MRGNFFSKLTACLLLSLFHSFVQGQTAPTGWKQLKTKSGLAFSPSNLAEAAYFRVTVLPPESLKGASLLEFIDSFADQDVRKGGQPIGKPSPASASNENFANTARVLQTKSRRLNALYFGISVDRRNARVLRITYDKDELVKKYQAGVSDLVKQLSQIEKTEAIASGRGVDMEVVPRTPQGMKPGGKIVPGVYVGNRIDDEGKIVGRFRIYLFDNLEFLVLNEEGELIDDYSSKGSFAYSPASGKLNLSSTFDFWNDRFDPDEQFCLYGTDSRGKKYIHAYDYYGVGSNHTKLFLSGPIDRFSPSQEKAALEKAKAELVRYKFVVKPGDGLRPEDVHGIFHDVKYEVGFNGNSAENSVYLVLKDGTVRDGLPVPYDELDVSLSKRRDRELWGKWMADGEGIKVAWPDRPDKFERVTGSWAIAANSRDKLRGTFSTGSTYGNWVTGSSWNIWGVTFSDGNRWERFRRGGASNGSLAQTANDTHIFSTYDDEGSVVSATTPGVVVSNIEKRKKGSDRKGTYQIDGWNIILTAENGEVTRLPFFFTSKNKKTIFFDGSSLSLDEQTPTRESK